MDAQLGHPALKSSGFKSEYLGCAALPANTPTAHLEYAEDMLALDLLQGQAMLFDPDKLADLAWRLLTKLGLVPELQAAHGLILAKVLARESLVLAAS
jgi:hypothetical protein